MADTLTPDDLDAVTRTVLAEAGNQGDNGMAAVASVIRNRVNSGQYGNSPSDVVLAPDQFSAWSLPRNDPNNPSRFSTKNPQYQHAANIVNSVWSGKTPDQTNGADHYLNPSIVQAQKGTLPAWAQGQPTAQIGAHSFYSQSGPDLLGAWNAPSTGAPSAGTAPASTAAPDLLGSWGNNAAPDITAGAQSPLRITIHPQNYAPAPGQPETPAQWTNRILAEHQGDNLTDEAVRLGVGGLRGVGDVADTIAQAAASTGTAGANVLQNAGVISPQTAGAVQNWGANVNQRVIQARNSFDDLSANSPLAQAGRIGGQIIGTGPLLGAGGAAIEGATGLSTVLAARPVIGAALTGAGAGAGASALTSAASDQSLGQQIGTGALAGGLLGPLGYGASKVGAGINRGLFGSIAPETAQLAQTARDTYGIPVTAGQMSTSPPVRFLDSVLQRLPFSGYASRTAQQQSGLNRAVANEMGVSVDAITPSVIDTAKKTAYADYDAAKSNMGTLNVDQKFGDDLKNVYDNAHYNLEPAQAKLVDKHLSNVLSKVDQTNGTLDPDLYQTLTRKNGPLDNAINSRDSKVSTYASNIKDALENLVGRNDPALKKLKDEADYKYFVAKSLENGRENLISASGDVNPSLLYGAVDRSGTPIGTLGQIGKRFMREPPSSGTTERALTMGLIGSGLGAIGYGGYEFDPDNFQRNAALSVAALLAGRGGSAILRSGPLANALIRSGGGSAQRYPFVNLLSRAAPAAALTYRNANGLPGQ